MFTERARRAATLACLVAASGCNGFTSYLDATGATGHSEAVLGRWLTVIACVVVAFVCVAILGGIARHRGEANAPITDEGERVEREPLHRDAKGNGNGRHGQRLEIRSGLNWIYIGLAVTVVILLGTFVGTMATLDAASRVPAAPGLEIDVIGHQWWWELRYKDPTHPDLGFVTANEIHLPVGVPVRVRVSSADVIHSFWLPQIGGKMDAIPGQTNETWLEARTAGVSRGTCAEYCGLEHAVMALDVVAEPRDKFDAWAKARRAEARMPSEPEAHAGAVVFARSCGACHAVAGTMALGRVGPDLTHVASRPHIGAGLLENTPANLARWIANPPAIKEGSYMPAIPLDSAEMRAVVAYLETLR